MAKVTTHNGVSTNKGTLKLGKRPAENTGGKMVPSTHKPKGAKGTMA